MTFFDSPPTPDLPRGLVTVDLINERGKVVQREQAENYLTPYLLASMKHLQRMFYGAYFAGSKPDDAYGLATWDLPPLPLNHIITWDDASAENTSDSNFRGSVVAFASRFPQGSPTGKRGVIDIGQSIATRSSQTYVFTWAPGQGNGTFQSVGWANCNTVGDVLGIWPDPFLGAAPVTTSISTPTTHYAGGLGHDGTGFVTLHTTGTTVDVSGYAVYRFDSAGVGTLLFNLPTTTFRYSGVAVSNGGTYCNLTDICVIGTDYYVVGFNNYNSSAHWTGVAKFNSAGVLQWYVKHDGGANEMPVPGSYFAGRTITTDGTNLYVGYGHYSTTAPNAANKIYQLSPDTGLVTATITPAWSICTPFALAWDGTSLRGFTGLETFAMDLSGQRVTSSSNLVHGGDSGTATAPLTGAYLGPTSAIAQPYRFMLWTSNTTNANDTMVKGSPDYGAAGYLPGDCLTSNMICHPYATAQYYAGKCYVLVGPTPGTVSKRLMEYSFASIGTRSRLSAPVTKDSSKMMKITYQFDFS